MPESAKPESAKTGSAKPSPAADVAAYQPTQPPSVFHREDHAIKDHTVIERHARTPIMHRTVQHGAALYLGGIVADDRSASMKGQTEQILARVGALLTEVGSDKSKVLSATIYITDMAMKDEMNEVWTSWFAPEHLPSRATIGVADLGPKTLIEVVVVAAK